MMSPEKKRFDYMSRPWLSQYGPIPHCLDYPDGTMYDVLRGTALKIPDHAACEFMGVTLTYRELLADVDRAASALEGLGVKKGDRVAVALPNIPQVLAAIYAANRLGAVCVMIHPLSSPDEMELFLSQTEPRVLFTLNLLYEKFRPAADRCGVKTCILCRIGDYLGPVKRLAVDMAYRFGGRVRPVEGKIIYWTELVKSVPPAATDAPYAAPASAGDCAAILYSGGTSGDPKGMALSNLNFNALAKQIESQYKHLVGWGGDYAMITVLPMFHGFGLGCCAHAMMLMGLRSVLVPRFSADEIAKLLKKKKPYLLAGPPTLYESLMRCRRMNGADMSGFIGFFSGGDKLPASTKERFDGFIAAHGGKVRLREGYGLTETVTACMLTPEEGFRPNCVGLPFPDMLVKICVPGTAEEVPLGEDGEICISGPTVMLGYIGGPDETDEIIKTHPDGLRWLHTGDMGWVDGDGYVYFRQRIKRIFKVSGYTVYPSMIEETVNTHPAVAMSCVVSVHDDVKLSRIKLYVELREGYAPSDALADEIRRFCREHLNVWSVPKTVEFIDKLPITKVGKVDFRQLQLREEAK